MGQKPGFLERLAYWVTVWVGNSLAFSLALLVIIVWAVTGPVFHFSDTWQLVINTGTTIVTFLMVFLIQRNQNKDSLTIQAKLNEIIAAVQGASNRLINIEDLSEEDIRSLHQQYQKLAQLVESDKDKDVGRKLSIEEAEAFCRAEQVEE